MPFFPIYNTLIFPRTLTNCSKPSEKRTSLLKKIRNEVAFTTHHILGNYIKKLQEDSVTVCEL